MTTKNLQKFYCNKSKNYFDSCDYEIMESAKNHKKYMLAKCINDCKGKGHCRLCKKESIEENIKEEKSNSKKSQEDLVTFEKPEKIKKIKEKKVKKNKVDVIIQSDEVKVKKEKSKRKNALVDEPVI